MLFFSRTEITIAHSVHTHTLEDFLFFPRKAGYLLLYRRIKQCITYHFLAFLFKIAGIFRNYKFLNLLLKKDFFVENFQKSLKYVESFLADTRRVFKYMMIE
jgi:hypothetical protein